VTREIQLSELTDREKDNVILVLGGALKDLRSRVELVAKTNFQTRRQLEEWAKTYAPRLGFLERAYARGTDARAELRKRVVNDRLWNRLTQEGA
jgi:CII-binding regulator of phage lambda lysogenization HflD